MAGSVTGNIGNENVTLRNIATEDTLSDILLEMQKANGKDPTRGAGGKLSQAGNEALKAGKKFAGVGAILSGLGDSAVKIVRNLDTNINNVSYSFSTIAGELRRDGNKLSKLFGYAAESVAQLQEQQSAYGRMIQVGGTVASEFDDLREQAAGLGVDLAGLVDMTEKFGFSLKVGSTTVAGGLKKLKEARDMSDDTIREFGRLGILPQKISEQLLIAAEAQGGFGDVMKRYNGDAAAFGKGMLKSTQELNIFATAVGSNSRLMQEEAAKAAQKIGNRIFLKTLSEGEQRAVQFFQQFTGSGEGAIEVMRSLKGQATSEQAALFQSLKGFTGMGDQIENFMGMISQGSDTLDALTKSGLLEYAKGLSDQDLARLEAQAYAMRKSGMENEAALLDQQFLLLKGLKDAKPDELKKYASELVSATGDGTRAIDSFTSLQQNQVKLAQTTAGVNKQMNRLGLAIATSIMKGTNLTIEGAGKGKDAAVKYFNDMLASYNLGPLPKDIAEKGIDKIEEWVDNLINVNLSNPSGGGGANASRTNNLVGTTISGSLVGMNDQITYKDKTGKIVKATLNDLLNKPELLSQSESFKGRNNRAETLALGAALQKNITTLSAITAGDDEHEKHQKGAHPAGRGLDFAVNTTGKDPKVEYERTEAAIKNYMENVLGLKKGDYFIKNELDYQKTGGTGPHMHVEVTESAQSKLREKFKMEMAPAAESTQKSGTGTQVSQNAVRESDATNSSNGGTRTVNTASNLRLEKPDWWDDAQRVASVEVVSKLTSLNTKVEDLAREINTLARQSVKV